ncbi:MAG: Zn-dependent alcohol dehydrogenase [Thermomicrobiales bacterium]
MKTRAAVLHEIGQPLVIEELELEEPREGEVLVRIAAAGVCHSDLHYMKGEWAIPKPAVLGHEGSGVVERVGRGVTRVKPGDHCVLIFRPNCGVCYHCTIGRPALCTGRVSAPGTMFDGSTRLSLDGKPAYHLARIACFSEYAVIAEEQLLPIPKEIPLDRAALVGCAVMTGVGAAMNTVHVEPGSTVAVIGCGGVGLNVVQGARMLNAGKIIAVDILDNKLDYAEQFGATHVVNAKEENPVQRVREITDGLGADYAFDALGHAATVQQAFEMVRIGGTAVEVGIAPQGQMAQIDAFALAFQEKTLKGSFYGSARPRVDMTRLLDLYQQGRLKLDELISRTYTLDEINEGFALLQGGAVARGVIVMQ